MRPFTETIHSDFLVHWSGKDIDEKYDRGWKSSSSSHKTNRATTQQYLTRLRSILKWGLWMTKDDRREWLKVNGKRIAKPLVARTCFTELKLSQVRKHAEKFGRLGIGVKRYFVFNRMGGPMIYMQRDKDNLLFPPYCDWLDAERKKHEICSFFKHMCSRRPLVYDLFSESEWRIVFSENIMNVLRRNRKYKTVRLFIDPKSSTDPAIKELISPPSGTKRPEYLIPLDGWFSLIVFPSPDVKAAAYEDQEIQELITQVKARQPRGCPPYEAKMRPIEVDLDACAHF